MKITSLAILLNPLDLYPNRRIHVRGNDALIGGLYLHRRRLFQLAQILFPGEGKDEPERSGVHERAEAHPARRV